MGDQRLAIRMLPGERDSYRRKRPTLESMLRDVNVDAPLVACGSSGSWLEMTPAAALATARAIRSVATAVGAPPDLELIALATRVERATAGRDAGGEVRRLPSAVGHGLATHERVVVEPDTRFTEPRAPGL